MHDPHPLFNGPKNEDQKIWRYMDITKLLDLITSSSLYFTRSDQFEDVWEGSYTELSVKSRKGMYAGLLEYYPEQKDAYSPESQTEHALQLKKEIGVNCWHINNYESAAMWKLYVKSNDGIAIQSTYSELSQCFFKADIPVFIGKVNYIDYEAGFIMYNQTFPPFLHKRTSFVHENELRCIVWVPSIAEDKDFSLKNGGVKVPVDLSILIENIYVSPESPEWMSDLLNNVIGKLNPKLPKVINSRIRDKPVF